MVVAVKTELAEVLDPRQLKFWWKLGEDEAHISYFSGVLTSPNRMTRFPARVLQSTWLVAIGD
jgi:hypothetical protein